MRLLTTLLIFCFITYSCNTTQDQKNESTSDDTLYMEYPEEDTINKLRRPYPSKLVGSWIAVKINVGDMIMTEEDMKEQGILAPVRNFYYDYTMRLGDSEDLPLLPFYYSDSIISTEDQGEEYIEKLTQDTLILKHIIDGERSRYIYVRKN